MIALVMVMLAADPQAKPVAADDTKVRCRVETVTGSLAQRTRICHTVVEWRAIDEANNAKGREMIERGQQACAACPHGE